MNKLADLKKDYSKAVEEYSKENYKYFLLHIRPVLEELGKLLIFDFLSDQDAESILTGKKYFSGNDDSGYKLKDSNRCAEGREIILNIKRGFFYSHPDLAKPRIDFERAERNKIQIKDALSSHVDDWIRFYIIASQLAEHSTEHYYNIRTQAKYCAIGLEAFFDFLKANKFFVRSSTVDFISSLPRFEGGYTIEDGVIKSASGSHSSHSLQQLLKGQSKDEPFLDDDQLDLIEETLDKNMIVSGCAGSGKSLIATYKAKQAAENGLNVILIAYTRSLKDFMRNDSGPCGYDIYNYDKWKNVGMPRADLLIVDEIQDFTRTEIEEFTSHTKKFIFVGDSAQSVYSSLKLKNKGEGTLTIEQIEDLTGVKALRLYNNYRLPKAVAKITQDYLGVRVQRFSEGSYMSTETAVPHIIKCSSEEDEVAKLQEIMKSYSDVGILLPSRDKIMTLVNQLPEGTFEVKYSMETEDHYEYSDIDFSSDLPKIMTYHSAKGLQFETVVLPFYEGADGDMLKPLYVAMTRTYKNLIVLYHGNLNKPLSKVPPELYLAE